MGLIASAKKLAFANAEANAARNTDPNSLEARSTLFYKAMTQVFADKILRRLDNGDERVSSRCACFMRQFFLSIDPNKIMWFSPNKPTPK
jgi:hypothetical protein